VRIVHLLGWYFPESVGGTEIYVEALCRRLRDAGHEVLVAAPDAHHTAPERYEHDHVPVFRYAIAGTPTRDEAQHRVAVRGAERLHQFLADERPDILHVHSFTTGIGLPEIRAARRLGIRVIVTCHLPGLGYMCRSGELMQWGRIPCDGVVAPDKCAACNLTRLGLPRPAARIVGARPTSVSAALQHLPGRLGTALGMPASVEDYEAMQRELFSLVERFVVLNETGRRMLVSNGSPAEKIVLNRLGVSHAAAAPAARHEARPANATVRFGYLGRFHPTKGLTALMQAAAQIPREVPFELEIRGPLLDEPARRYAAELRRMAGGDPRIAFAPSVAPAEVPALLAGYDALLCPSIWFENGPTVALEAIAAGTPIIASRVGNLAELIADDINGLLVPPGDVNAWARALARVATVPAETIVRWRGALAKPRSMDDVTADYLTLYEEGVGTLTGPPRLESAATRLATR
jgi:glycosyltransferase involved in cell wall biosynthesis